MSSLVKWSNCHLALVSEKKLTNLNSGLLTIHSYPFRQLIYLIVDCIWTGICFQIRSALSVQPIYRWRLRVIAERATPTRPAGIQSFCWALPATITNWATFASANRAVQTTRPFWKHLNSIKRPKRANSFRRMKTCISWPITPSRYRIGCWRLTGRTKFVIVNRTRRSINTSRMPTSALRQVSSAWKVCCCCLVVQSPTSLFERVFLFKQFPSIN